VTSRTGAAYARSASVEEWHAQPTDDVDETSTVGESPPMTGRDGRASDASRGLAWLGRMPGSVTEDLSMAVPCGTGWAPGDNGRAAIPTMSSVIVKQATRAERARVQVTRKSVPLMEIARRRP